MTVFYIYNKKTMEFSGSGVTQIENDEFSSVKIVPPPEPEYPVLYFNEVKQEWEWK